jgi:hypothetical protein
MKKTIIPIAIIAGSVFMSIGVIRQGFKSPAEIGKEQASEQAKQDQQNQELEQWYQNKMAADYKKLERKAWTGTENDLREFQNWKDKHVRLDGSFE